MGLPPGPRGGGGLHGADGVQLSGLLLLLSY